MSPRLRLLIAGSTGFAVIGVLPALYGVALPGWSRRFGLGEAEAAFLLTLHGLGAGSAVIAGIFGLPFLTFRVGLACLGLGGGLAALEPGWPGLLAGVGIMGLGYGVLSAVVNRRFLAEFGGNGAGMVALVNAVFAVGSIAGPLLFVAAGGAPRPVLVAVAVVSLLLIPVVQPSGRRAEAVGLPDLRQGRLAILVFNFMGIGNEVLAIGFGPSALIAGGVPEARAATLASAFFVAFLASRLALYGLARRVRADTLYLATFAGLCVTFGLATVWPQAGFVAAGAFVATAFPVFFVWASSILGPDPRMSAAILSSGLVGAVGFPAVAGPLLEAYGSGLLFPVLAVMNALTALALLAALGPTRRLAPAP